MVASCIGTDGEEEWEMVPLPENAVARLHRYMDTLARTAAHYGPTVVRLRRNFYILQLIGNGIAIWYLGPVRTSLLCIIRAGANGVWRYTAPTEVQWIVEIVDDGWRLY